jgi:hypothetical protein
MAALTFARASFEITGPMSVSGRRGSPTTMRLASSTNFPTKRPAMESTT